MQKFKVLVLALIMSLLAACSGVTGGNAGSGTLEFNSTGGSYRVIAAPNWKVSDPMMGFTSLMTNENDIKMFAIIVDPPAATLNTYRNKRQLTAANGKTVTVYAT